MASRVLVVCVDSPRRAAYEAALATLADTVLSATMFAEAKSIMLATKAEVLVTDLRLHEFNGVHLTIWARTRLGYVRSIVVGPPNATAEQDLKAIGASYVSSGDMEDVVEAVREALTREHPKRRWSRRRLKADVAVAVDGTPARLLDVSYGGFRVEISHMPRAEAPTSAEAPGSFVLDIPQFDLREQATSKWVRAAERGGVYWCGAALDLTQTHARSRWRALVEALTAQAFGGATWPSRG